MFIPSLNLFVSLHRIAAQMCLEGDADARAEEEEEENEEAKHEFE